MGDGHKQLWVKTFQPLVVRAFNAVRSDIQSSIRTAYMGWAIKYPDDPFLPIDLIKKCVLRTIDLSKEQEKRVFMWYWTEIARKYLDV